MSGKPHPIVEPSSGENGQILPLMAMLCAVGVAAALAVSHIGGVLEERARASTAADAAALAGAVEGREGAAALAVAHGGVLEHFERDGADTVVVVRVGRARAESRARLESRTGSTADVLGTVQIPPAPSDRGHPVHSTVVLRSSSP